MSELRSYHVHRNYLILVFQNFQLNYIIQGVYRIFPQTIKTCLLITKDVLHKTTNLKLQLLEKLNIDTTLKVANANLRKSANLLIPN